MNPNEQYNSGAVPHGSIYAKIYRNRDNPVLVGTYLIENMDPVPEVIEVNRPATDAGENGFVWTEGKIEGAVTIQRNITLTPTVKTGWFFKSSSITVDENGAPVPEIYAIKAPSRNIGTDYRKQSGTIRLDRQPTAAQLNIDEYAN